MNKKQLIEVVRGLVDFELWTELDERVEQAMEGYAVVNLNKLKQAILEDMMSAGNIFETDAQKEIDRLTKELEAAKAEIEKLKARDYVWSHEVVPKLKTDLEALKQSQADIEREVVNLFGIYCRGKYDAAFDFAADGDARHAITSQKTIINNLVAEYISTLSNKESD